MAWNKMHPLPLKVRTEQTVTVHVKWHTRKKEWCNIYQDTEKGYNKPLMQRNLLFHPTVGTRIFRLRPSLAWGPPENGWHAQCEVYDNERTLSPGRFTLFSFFFITSGISTWKNTKWIYAFPVFPMIDTGPFLKETWMKYKHFLQNYGHYRRIS